MEAVPHLVSSEPERLCQFTITCGKRLGEGTSGAVYAVHGPLDGKRYAVKTVALPEGRPTTAQLAECRLHATLPPHAGLVAYHFSWVSDNALHILLECIDGEMLWDTLGVDEGPADSETAVAERLAWCISLLSVLDHLHSHSTCHRDMSPWNCFVSSERVNGSTGRQLKVGDLGLAVRVPETGAILFGMEADGYAPLDNSAIGSLYSAPELGAESGYDAKAADVYSCGMTMFAIWNAVAMARGRATLRSAAGSLVTGMGTASAIHTMEQTANLPAEAVGEASGSSCAGVCISGPVAMEELTRRVERLKATGELPGDWMGMEAPLIDLVLRMVSPKPEARPSSREALEMLQRMAFLPVTQDVERRSGQRNSSPACFCHWCCCPGTAPHKSEGTVLRVGNTNCGAAPQAKDMQR